MGEIDFREIDYLIYYKKWHSENIEHYENMASYYEKNFHSYLPKNKDVNILDVGCGFGLALYALKKMGYKNIKGIEVSEESVKVCQSKGLDVELVQDSIRWLKENQNKFDIIMALDVLEHLPIQKHIQFLKTINQSLKDNGKFICTVPNANSTFSSRWRYIDWTHYTSFTEHSLEFLLLNSGFTSVEIREIEFLQRPKYPFIIRKSVIHFMLWKIVRLLRRLEAIAELGKEGISIPLSLNILGIAEK